MFRGIWMRILVTGGAGFIGSELVKALIKEGHTVSVFSRRTNGDITDKCALKTALRGQDAAFHLAALNDQLAPYERLHEINVIGTENIIKESINQGIGKLVYASSAAFSVSRITPYGLSKKEAEDVVKKFWEKINIPILRYPIVYDEPNIKKMMQFGNFPMTTKKNIWHLCYRKSLISAYLTALEKGKSEVYLIADKKPVSSHELYETLMKAQGYRPFYIHHAFIQPFFYFPYAFKMLQMLGVKPPITPELLENIFQDRAFETTKKLKYEKADTLETFKKIIKRIEEK
jgi:nucleoside-diphosphate-sugar epimerase